MQIFEVESKVKTGTLLEKILFVFKLLFPLTANKLKCPKKSPLGAHSTKNLRRVPLFRATLNAYNSG